MAAFDDRELAVEVGRLIRSARMTIGWSQQELGDRAHVAQSMVSRLERGVRAGADLDDLQRIAKAMGGRLTITLTAPFLADRGRQRDRVHAACVGYVVRHLRQTGWRAESEVEINGRSGLGWIDVLAWHPSSGALLVIEIKTEIHDFGRVQRTLSWYESRSWDAARRLGWSPRRSHAALILLDSEAVTATLRANRDLADQAFPERAARLTAFVVDPASSILHGRSMATVDPLSRRRIWLRSTGVDRRRRPPAYLDYAAAARHLAR
jgi:transcriptional regulator with XRE-family HTH domain